MKYSFLLLAALFSVFFGAGCNKDEELTLGEELEGQWVATSYLVDNQEFIFTGMLNGLPGIVALSLDFTDFIVGENEGEIRINTQLTNSPVQPEVVGVYKVVSSGIRLELPRFYPQSLSRVSYRWEIEDYVRNERLRLTANIDGFFYVLRLDKR
ncbi:MAG: hypothetical protein HC821_03885 [Lewinella sp.]|nr:hypothetical protein [Lewinella sp.]